MFMKKFSLILLFLTINCLFSQSKKEVEFQNTIKKVINLYNDKNFDELNKLIDNENGIYFITKNGVYEYWYLKSGFSSNDSLKEAHMIYPYNDIIKQQEIYNSFDKIYFENYSYNCNAINKEGIYIKSKDNMFSNLIKKYIEFNDLGLNEKDLKLQLKKIKKIECSSRKIILISNEEAKWGKSFIFYLTYSNKKWFLTIIDFATLDCSV